MVDQHFPLKLFVPSSPAVSADRFPRGFEQTWIHFSPPPSSQSEVHRRREKRQNLMDCKLYCWAVVERVSTSLTIQGPVDYCLSWRRRCLSEGKQILTLNLTLKIYKTYRYTTCWMDSDVVEESVEALMALAMRTSKSMTPCLILLIVFVVRQPSVSYNQTPNRLKHASSSQEYLDHQHSKRKLDCP